MTANKWSKQQVIKTTCTLEVGIKQSTPGDKEAYYSNLSEVSKWDQGSIYNFQF